MKTTDKTTLARAEKRVIRAELVALRKAAIQVRADFRAEQKTVFAAFKKAEQAVQHFQARASKQLPKQLAVIDKRLAILSGRLLSL